jgi:hydrogenase-4 component F
VLLAIIIFPLILGGAVLLVPSATVRAWLVPTAGAIHAVLTAIALIDPPSPLLGQWLALGDLGRVILGIVSAQFFVCSLYVPAYLARHPERSNRGFCACLIALLGTMSLVPISHHLGLMWVGLETSTLATAPLVYFHRTRRSLEAVWKYLLIGSLGVALALLGSFFLASAALHSGVDTTLLFDDLVREAPLLSKPWLHCAFVVLLVGYGTKIGLAPMHTWKPDVYGEAPGVVGAVLAGGLATCAFCALLRFVQICNAAGEGALARELLLAFGLLSMGVAAVFMIRQRDYKRMLAYSSVEHMGIVAVGLGIGGRLGTYGALLHLVSNSFGKVVLFLTAGNIQHACGSKLVADAEGSIRRVPASATMFLIGLFAITGSPPFGLFLSELAILRASIATQSYVVAALFLALLATVFIGMSAAVIKVVQGGPADTERRREPVMTLVAPALCLAIVLVLGIYLPDWLDGALEQATTFVETGKS